MNSVDEQPREAVSTSIWARPPVLYLGCVLLGLALDSLLPLPLELPGPALMRAAGGGLLLIGVAILYAGARNFIRAGTPVRSIEPVRELVTTGLHRWSRNPIYVGMLLIYAGIGIAARSPWVLLLALPLVITVRYVVVAREEAYLERHFGDAYRAYKARVRRWL